MSKHDAIYGSKDGKTYIGGDPADGGTFAAAPTAAGDSKVVFINSERTMTMIWKPIEDLDPAATWAIIYDPASPYWTYPKGEEPVNVPEPWIGRAERHVPKGRWRVDDNEGGWDPEPTHYLVLVDPNGDPVS